jgi:hypothetical protein
VPFGQSTPVAVPLAAIAGEIARTALKKHGCGEVAPRIGSGVTRTLASAATGYCVNAVLGVDVTAAAVTTVRSPTTAALHALWPSGHSVGGGPLRF